MGVRVLYAMRFFLMIKDLTKYIWSKWKSRIKAYIFYFICVCVCVCVLRSRGINYGSEIHQILNMYIFGFVDESYILFSFLSLYCFPSINIYGLARNGQKINPRCLLVA